MHILVTGADGYIGRALVRRLAADPQFADPGHTLTLVDLHFDAPVADKRAHCLRGSLTDPDILAAATATPPDIVFHMAAVASAEAESNFDWGLETNVGAFFALLKNLRRQGNTPRLVFTSSIGVYGQPLPPKVTDATSALPDISYGAEKLIAETMLRDYSRRGWVEGVSLRLPGIVARPEMPSGAGSVFISDLMRRLAQGQPYTAPVSAAARMWLMSCPTCVDNILHAARMPRELESASVFLLPALHVAIGDLIDALAARFGDEIRNLLSFEPDPQKERIFGTYPPLVAQAALDAGFTSDGSIDTLAARALEGILPAEKE